MDSSQAHSKPSRCHQRHEQSDGIDGYYMVLVFFAALFIGAFRDSNIGILIAVKGADYLKTLPAR